MTHSAKSRGRKEPQDAPRPDTDGKRPGDRDAPKREVGGAEGPEPTRYGDWEHNGRCTDF
jgi:hypothetical protein